MRAALAFLTRLPLPDADAQPAAPLARAMGVFPLAGAIIGACGAVAYAAARAIFPPILAAPVAVAATVLLTGALHEDGLADTADGFGGGRDRDGKLAIMRDSRIGTYGVVALVLVLVTRIAALAVLDGPWQVAGGLVAAHALARAAIPVAMQAIGPARPDGLGAAAGTPGASTAGMAALLALVIAALVLPPDRALAAAVAALAGASIVTLVARRQIGGHTGDVLGAIEQVAETLALAGVVAAR